MKLTFLDFIPFYGSYKYFKRYFYSLEKPINKEITQAIWMWYYHIFIGVGIPVLFIIKLLLILK